MISKCHVIWSSGAQKSMHNIKTWCWEFRWKFQFWLAAFESQCGLDSVSIVQGFGLILILFWTDMHNLDTWRKIVQKRHISLS